MTSEETFICYKCNKTFKSKMSLNGHINSSKTHKSILTDVNNLIALYTSTLVPV